MRNVMCLLKSFGLFGSRWDLVSSPRPTMCLVKREIRSIILLSKEEPSDTSLLTFYLKTALYCISKCFLRHLQTFKRCPKCLWIIIVQIKLSFRIIKSSKSPPLLCMYYRHLQLTSTNFICIVIAGLLPSTTTIYILINHFEIRMLY